MTHPVAPSWLDRPVDDDLWDAFEAACDPAFLAVLEAVDDVAPTVRTLRESGRVVGDDLRTDPLGAQLVAARGVPVTTDLREVLDLVARDLGAGERTGSIFPRFA